MSGGAPGTGDRARRAGCAINGHCCSTARNGCSLYRLRGAGDYPSRPAEWRQTVDVAAWLKNLSLGQYEATFRDNAIDGDLLPSLTAEDLRIWASRSSATGENSWTRSPRSAQRPSRRSLPPPRPDSHFVRARRVFPASAEIGCRRGASSDHGDVLRSRRLDGACGAARRGRLAQPR